MLLHSSFVSWRRFACNCLLACQGEFRQGLFGERQLSAIARTPVCRPPGMEDDAAPGTDALASAPWHHPGTPWSANCMQSWLQRHSRGSLTCLRQARLRHALSAADCVCRHCSDYRVKSFLTVQEWSTSTCITSFITPLPTAMPQTAAMTLQHTPLRVTACPTQTCTVTIRRTATQAPQRKRQVACQTPTAMQPRQLIHMQPACRGRSLLHRARSQTCLGRAPMLQPSLQMSPAPLAKSQALQGRMSRPQARRCSQQQILPPWATSILPTCMQHRATRSRRSQQRCSWRLAFPGRLLSPPHPQPIPHHPTSPLPRWSGCRCQPWTPQRLPLSPKSPRQSSLSECHAASHRACRSRSLQMPSLRLPACLLRQRHTQQPRPPGDVQAPCLQGAHMLSAQHSMSRQQMPGHARLAAMSASSTCGAPTRVLAQLLSALCIRAVSHCRGPTTLPPMLVVPFQVICELLTQSIPSSPKAQQGQQAPPLVQDAQAPLSRQATQRQGQAQVQAAGVPEAVSCSSCSACQAPAERHTLALHLTHTSAGGALCKWPQPHSLCWPLEPRLSSSADQAAHPRGEPRACMTVCEPSFTSCLSSWAAGCGSLASPAQRRSVFTNACSSWQWSVVRMLPGIHATAALAASMIWVAAAAIRGRGDFA